MSVRVRACVCVLSRRICAGAYLSVYRDKGALMVCRHRRRRRSASPLRTRFEMRNRVAASVSVCMHAKGIVENYREADPDRRGLT